MTQARFNRSSLSSGGSLPDRRNVPAWVLWLGAVLTIAVVAIASGVGQTAAPLSGPHRFLEFYSGVFSLVALSITVMIGLAATDRVVLMIRHRVLLQAVHRAMALAAMVFLGLHIIEKVAEGHADAVDVVVPFMADHRAGYIGLGTLAGYLMVLAGWTGVARRSFAGQSYAGLWRVLHVTAYPCWLIALVHGLKSGRTAATWVTVSYVICGIMVGVALLVRLFMTLNKRTHVTKAQTMGTIKPVGRRAAGNMPPLATNVPMATVDTPMPAADARNPMADRHSLATDPRMPVVDRHSLATDPRDPMVDRRGPVTDPRSPVVDPPAPLVDAPLSFADSARAFADTAESFAIRRGVVPDGPSTHAGPSTPAGSGSRVDGRGGRPPMPEPPRPHTRSAGDAPGRNGPPPGPRSRGWVAPYTVPGERPAGRRADDDPRVYDDPPRRPEPDTGGRDRSTGHLSPDEVTMAAPAAPPGREVTSDEEFWAYMRGEAPR